MLEDVVILIMFFGDGVAAGAGECGGGITAGEADMGEGESSEEEDDEDDIWKSSTFSSQRTFQTSRNIAAFSMICIVLVVVCTLIP